MDLIGEKEKRQRRVDLRGTAKFCLINLLKTGATKREKFTTSGAALRYPAHLERTHQGQFKLPECGLHEESDGGGCGCQQSASSTGEKTKQVESSHSSHSKTV